MFQREQGQWKRIKITDSGLYFCTFVNKIFDENNYIFAIRHLLVND